MPCSMHGSLNIFLHDLPGGVKGSIPKMHARFSSVISLIRSAFVISLLPPLRRFVRRLERLQRRNKIRRRQVRNVLLQHRRRRNQDRRRNSILDLHISPPCFFFPPDKAAADSIFSQTTQSKPGLSPSKANVPSSIRGNLCKCCSLQLEILNIPQRASCKIPNRSSV